MISILILFFALILCSHAHTNGVATIDALIFDKVVREFDTVLVKFDDRFPFGDKQQQFEKFAESVAGTKGFLVAEVPMTDVGDRNNDDLARKYNVKRAEYPVYKLFLKKLYKPVDYTGDKTEADLKRFVSQHSSHWFGEPGTLEALDYLARDFFDASTSKDKKGQNTLLLRAESEMKKLTEEKDQKNGQTYLKIMETIAKQGLDFLKQEQRRIENLLKGKISNEKKEELQHRLNIIASFKSAKDSVMYKLNEGQQQFFGNQPPPPKDL